MGKRPRIHGVEMETIQPDAQEAEPTTRLSRSTIVHDQEADNAEMRRENEFMAHEIGEMHKELADENAAWMWRMVKTHAPWVTVVASMIGSGVYWVLTHTITIGSKP